MNWIVAKFKLNFNLWTCLEFRDSSVNYFITFNCFLINLYMSDKFYISMSFALSRLFRIVFAICNCQFKVSFIAISVVILVHNVYPILHLIVICTRCNKVSVSSCTYHLINCVSGPIKPGFWCASRGTFERFKCRSFVNAFICFLLSIWIFVFACHSNCTFLFWHSFAQLHWWSMIIVGLVTVCQSMSIHWIIVANECWTNGRLSSREYNWEKVHLLFVHR